MILLAASAAVPVAGILTPGTPARRRSRSGRGRAHRLPFGLPLYGNWTPVAGACSAIKAELRLYEASVAPYDDPATRDEILLRKINSTELTETAQWMTLPGPGTSSTADTPGTAKVS